MFLAANETVATASISTFRRNSRVFAHAFALSARAAQRCAAEPHKKGAQGKGRGAPSQNEKASAALEAGPLGEGSRPLDADELLRELRRERAAGVRAVGDEALGIHFWYNKIVGPNN